MKLGLGRGALGGVALLAFAACAKPRPPIQPYMSVAGHETTAKHFDQTAQREETRYNPYARLNGGMCRGAPAPGEDVCWTSLVNPTEQYLKHAEEHRKLAAEHRAAAKTLRDAESRACAGIADEDRDESLFDHRDDILRIDPLRGGVGPYLKDPATEGVVVTFRPVPGMTVPWLQRVVDCQLARNAALGNDVPQLTHCLLVPKGVRATVSAVADGFAVTIRAGDKATAEELFRRADALAALVRAAAAPVQEPPPETTPVETPAAPPPAPSPPEEGNDQG
jgi:hypothetical protein